MNYFYIHTSKLSVVASHPPVKPELCPVAFRLYIFFCLEELSLKMGDEEWEKRRAIPRRAGGSFPKTPRRQQQSQDPNSNLQAAVPPL